MGTSMLERSAQHSMVESLSHSLADTYVVYLKTQNFHWNVVDSRFQSLHKLFEEQYEALADAVDEIAERIRMLKGRAPGSMREFLSLTQLKENDRMFSGDDMIRHLMKDHEKIIDFLHKAIAEATKANDDGTADLLIQRIRAHEKMAWMLRAHLADRE